MNIYDTEMTHSFKIFLLHNLYCDDNDTLALIHKLCKKYVDMRPNSVEDIIAKLNYRADEYLCIFKAKLPSNVTYKTDYEAECVAIIDTDDPYKLLSKIPIYSYMGRRHVCVGNVINVTHIFVIFRHIYETLYED